MKKLLLLFVCFVMLFISLPQNCVYAEQQFKRPIFENGGIMSLEMDGFSYYYKDKNAENDDVQPNNTLIRFDYNSGERLYLADNVVYFISDGIIIYYISGVTGDNQIWKMNCDGTNKEHIYSFSSNCVTSIQYYKKDGIFGLIDSNGIPFEITVPLKNTEQNSNTSVNDFVGNNYVGLYGVKETEAVVGNVLYQASIDGELKRTNLNNGEIAILAHKVTKFVTNGQSIYYDTYNEATKKNEIYYIDCNGQNQKLVLSGDGINLQGCWKNKYLYYENIDFTNQNVSFTTWMYDIQTHQKNLLFNQRMGTFKTYRDKLYYIKYTGNDLNKNVGLYSSNFDGSKETLLVNKAYEFNILNNELYYAKYNDDSEYNSDFYMEKSSINGEYPIALCDTIRTTLGVCQKIYEDRISIVNYDFISEKKYKQLEITVLLDNKKIEFDQPPIIVDGRTLVPLRAIFETMGATVNWDGNTQTVTSTKGKTTISMSIGKTEMYKNGELITLDVAPQLAGGRTLVPVRAVAEGFDCKVDWDSNTQTVIITKSEIAEPYKEIANYASNLCFIVEELGGEEFFSQMLKHNDLVYDTLNELDDAIDFQETVLTLEGGALEISKTVLKFATGNYGGAANEIAGALISNGSDVMFAALKECVPDMQSFIYNIGITACEKQEDDIKNIKSLHSKLKSGEYTEGDAVSYIYLYYQMMINNENSSLSMALLQNELPEGFLESLKESLKEAASVFIPSISGDILDLNIATEAMMSILEEYASFVCGETNDFYAQMIENINDPAVIKWSKNVQSYTNAINEKLASIK